MFGLDAANELLQLLWRNRVRTALTALAVSWGIFLLVILVALGRGLENGAVHDFRDDAVNSIWIRGMKVSLPFNGRAPGRKVQFKNADLLALQRRLNGIEHLSGRYYVSGNFAVSHGPKSAHFDIRGVHPDHVFLEKTLITEGRFINPRDIDERRKVAVIGPLVQKALFGDEPYLGREIQIRGVIYQVVGLYDDEGGRGELSRIYIPISTAQLVYHGSDNIHHILFTVGEASNEQSAAMEQRARSLLSERHGISLADRRALNINNNLIRFQKVSEIFRWISAFVWLVGLGTLLAGVVGVSNILLISVQERSVEIGIRKALGATPLALVRMVLSEALVITLLAGYFGLFSGVALVEFARPWFADSDLVRNPEVDLKSSLIALAILVSAAMIAGAAPAWRAALVKPIVAMRSL
jgi:putative ABC transport system permease protein